MRRDDRFSRRTTHVSPTALYLAQNAEKSEPIRKKQSTINNSNKNVIYEPHIYTIPDPRHVLDSMVDRPD
jgi:hypothetical protein